MAQVKKSNRRLASRELVNVTSGAGRLVLGTRAAAGQ
jgi:hypothetical protein